MMTQPVYPQSYPQAYPAQPSAPQPYAAQPDPAAELAAQPGWPAAPPQPPAQAWPQQPGAQQAPQAAWARPAAIQAPSRQPIFRAQAPDDPPSMPETSAPAAATPPAAAAVAPAPLSMPSPDQLGITTATATPAPAVDVDWTAARQRLTRLGAVSFNLDQLPQGACRFTCFLPTDQVGRTHRVEAAAASEAEAIRLALGKAEQWAGRK